MSVTAARGFLASAIACGISDTQRLDLSIVFAEKGPVPAAGVFTQNRAAAAPVALSRTRVGSGRARAVILNSGCANAGTGPAGIDDAELISRRTAVLLADDPEAVLMCSTGPIGPRLPVDRILRSLPRLIEGASTEGGRAAAEAILTTDSRAKITQITGDGFVVGGMAKGAGMLRPDLATMLCVLTTDAVADGPSLGRLLTKAVEPTFNSLNVDGCESTNDTVLLLASGEGARPLEDDLGAAVEAACRKLAREIATDAEGASRVVTLRIAGAQNDAIARHYGRAIADSGLVRASFYGGDPNWGRILAALGTCQVDPAVVSISYEGVEVALAGTGLPFDDQQLSKLLIGDFEVDILVGDGHGFAEVITTDLTPDYVRFNGERS